MNTYQEINSITGKQLDQESIEYLTKPIKRFTFVSDDKTIRSIKDKIRYYSKTYSVPTDRYINISNTLLLNILQKIQRSPKYGIGKKSKTKRKSKRNSNSNSNSKSNYKLKHKSKRKKKSVKRKA